MFFHGKRNNSQIALTFDDGPSEETEKVLEILKKYNIKATFFIVGKMVAGRERIVEKALQEGHEFGNHTFSHAKLWFKSKAYIEQEIKKCDAELARVGIQTEFFRFPAFRFGFSALSACRKLHKKIIFADVLSYDWLSYDWLNPWFMKRKDIHGALKVNKVAQLTLSKVQNGSIIVFHDYLQGLGPNAEIAEILEKVLPELKKRNFTFVTISQLIS